MSAQNQSYEHTIRVQNNGSGATIEAYTGSGAICARNYCDLL
jgi:hypothetical protein